MDADRSRATKPGPHGGHVSVNQIGVPRALSREPNAGRFPGGEPHRTHSPAPGHVARCRAGQCPSAEFASAGPGQGCSVRHGPARPC